ncbi:uncharacterized protein LOC123313604 [Coccinella septempunctata]|uniref:uncharacterized protein LOC123313604 n=2 Tax=Coccinella septempunctata TaxID=41139 RepID=UPI001D064A16|nr:uncharacterized protein LOC123313604 [Coccinella septempunctata]
MIDILSDVESFINFQTQWLSDVKNSVRLSLCNIIHNFYRRLDTCKIRDGLSRTLLFWYDKTRLFLKNHSDICVLNSDKGNKTVILSKVEYDEKLRQLLSDTSTYKLLRSDPTKKIQVSGNKLISELHTGGFINDREAKSMKQYNSLPPKIYGLVKIHKSNRPLRPVISCCNSPTFNISKFLVGVLDGIRCKFTYSLKNSFTLVSNLRDIVIPDDYVLVSFDVVSLFTNIPQGLIFDLVDEHWEDLKSHTQIPITTVKNIIQFIFVNSYCTYDGLFYSQIRGSAMGNPASPILAEMVMNKMTLFYPFQRIRFHKSCKFSIVSIAASNLHMS